MSWPGKVTTSRAAGRPDRRPARPRADRLGGERLEGQGRRPQAQARQGRQDGPTARRRSRRRAATPSGARGTSPAASATSCTPSPGTTRSWSSSSCSATPAGARDHRAQGDPGRPRRTGRLAPGGALLATQHAREWIRTEVDRRLLHYFIDKWRANERGRQEPAQDPRAVVRARRQPRRLPVHVRPRATVAEEPAGQRRRRPDHRRRRRRPEPQLPRALELRQGGLVGADPSDTYRGPAPASEPETRAHAGALDRVEFRFQVNYHSFGQ